MKTSPQFSELKARLTEEIRVEAVLARDERRGRGDDRRPASAQSLSFRGSPKARARNP